MAISLEDDPSNGRVLMRFSLPLADYPEPVSVVGTFNDWTPGNDLLIDHGDGTIGANVAVARGSEVRFRYLGSSGRWFDEPDADEITEYGSVVRVPIGSAESGSAAAETPQRPIAGPANAGNPDTVATPPDDHPRKAAEKRPQQSS